MHTDYNKFVVCRESTNYYNYEDAFHDKISGTKQQRVGLDEALSFVHKGDTLVVWKLDRLGRSIKHLIETVNALYDRGIGFKSMQEGMDTSTSGGKLIFHIFGALAEFEREVIRERTHAGLQAARSRGKKGGRKKKMDNATLKMASALMKDQTMTIKEICDKVGCSRATLYRYLNPDGSLK